MATQDIAGLLGPTPAEYQAAQQQAASANALKLAELPTGGLARYGMLMAGQNLGGAIGGALGYQDPLQQENERRNVMFASGGDLTTSKGILEKARQFAAAGDQRTALSLMLKGKELQKQESEEGLRNAQSEQALAHAEFYRTGGGATKEYQQQVDIYLDPTSTQAEKDAAKARMDALNAKGLGKNGAGTIKRMSTNIGEIIFDPAAKKYTYADGSEIDPADLRRMVPLGNDPTNVAAVAMAKGGAKEKSVAMAKAQDALPEATNTFNQSRDVIGQITNDPAFSSFVGFSWKPGAKYVPGSREAGLYALTQQLSALAEMHQREKLKGTGQITDYESNMARGAILRASNAQSEEAFKKSLHDFEYWMGRSMEALHERANTPFKMPETPALKPQAQESQPQQEASNVFRNISTPAEVKAAVNNGTMSRQDARAILLDMQSRGIEIK